MKAMVLEHTGPVASSPLRLVDLPLPEPQVGEVRLKVRCCAICRTDLHVIEGDLPQQKMPIVPGHQVVGIVDALGPPQEPSRRMRETHRPSLAGTSTTSASGALHAPYDSGGRRLKLGQRAGIAWLRHTCGKCEFCTRGRENLCEAARFTGYHADGGYAEYAVVPEDFAYEIPAVFSDVEAAPLLCAGIIGYRALRRAELPNGGRLAMYGFGSSAHVVIQIALHHGCEVYVVTRGERHRDLARQMGATWVGEKADEMPVKVDSAILFAPVGDLVPPALAALKKGGTLSLAGIYMTPIPPMDYERYVFYERNLHSVTCNTRDDGRELLAEAAAIPIRPHTTTYPLADANRGLQDLKNDRISGTGVLVMGEE